jgi:adenylyltransferase/sulfurtransferase
MSFSDAEIERYARHLILPEIGGAGQAALARARVLVVGAGGLGTPVLMYLAAAGVGRIDVVDDDAVDLSNLQRQVIHDTAAIGMPKVESAAARLSAINPQIAVTPHGARLRAGNAEALIAPVDLVVDGSDSFAARYLLADACHLVGRPLVSGALLRFEGQVASYRSHLGAPHPCYRCLYPAPPAPGTVPNCAEAGVLGALAGVIGSLQAVEAVKLIAGAGSPLDGRLLILDALDMRTRTIAFGRDPACALCGPQATIKDLSAHD